MKLRQGNIFTGICQSFCSQGEDVCLSACWDTPKEAHPPLGSTPPFGKHTSLGSTPPSGKHIPLEAHTPPGSTPPRSTPPQEAPPGSTPLSLPSDGHCSGRYASYWNAFLLFVFFLHSYFVVVRLVYVFGLIVVILYD